MKSLIKILAIALCLVSLVCLFASCEETGKHQHMLILVEASEPTCSESGVKQHYYCTECDGMFEDAKCQVELTSSDVVIEALAHDFTDATCTEAQTCKVCKTTKGQAIGHKWKAPTCTEPKTCKVCKVTEGAALGHVEAEAVQENYTAASCTAAGSYDTVTYCSVCEGELERVTTTLEQLDHTPVPDTTVVENYVDATCYAEGSYETVTYCSVCEGELERVTTTIDKLDHTWGAAVVENLVDATCTSAGSYDRVIYCGVDECHEELFREQKAIKKTLHTPADAVVENLVPATCVKEGYCDMVVYCAYCSKELSREGKIVDIDPNNHTNAAEYTALVDATVDSEGNIAHYACPDCGCYYLDEAYENQITSPVLPKLNVKDYTSSTTFVKHAVTPSVTTAFILNSDEIEYSVTLSSNTVLTVNRGEGEIAVSQYDYEKLNTDIVTVTYEADKGYTYSVAEGHTETGITGVGIRSSGAVVTIIGNVELTLTSRWGHNNGLIVGTDEKSANVTVTVTNTNNDDKHGIGMWDGSYLTVSKGSTLNVNNTIGDSINANDSESVFTFAGKVNTSGNITNPGQEIITSTGNVYVGKGMYKTSGSITVDGILETGTYINFTTSGTLTINGTIKVGTDISFTKDSTLDIYSSLTVNGKLTAGAKLTIPVCNSLIVNGTMSTGGGLQIKDCRSLVINEKATVTVGTWFDALGAAENDASYEYGFKPRVYVGGTLNVKNGKFKVSSLQVGSEEDDVSGTLNLYHNDNNVDRADDNAMLRYTFAKGTISLDNKNTGKCGFDIGGSKGNAYIDIRSGMTFETTKNYASIIGEWSDATYNLYVDLGFTFKGSVNNFLQLPNDTKHCYFYRTQTVNIDGVEKKVVVASYEQTKSHPISALNSKNIVAEGLEFNSTTETKDFGVRGTFTKATDASGNTIYYQVVK